MSHVFAIFHLSVVQLMWYPSTALLNLSHLTTRAVMWIEGRFKESVGPTFICQHQYDENSKSIRGRIISKESKPTCSSHQHASSRFVYSPLGTLHLLYGDNFGNATIRHENYRHHCAELGKERATPSKCKCPPPYHIISSPAGAFILMRGRKTSSPALSAGFFPFSTLITSPGEINRVWAHVHSEGEDTFP